MTGSGVRIPLAAPSAPSRTFGLDGMLTRASEFSTVLFIWGCGRSLTAAQNVGFNVGVVEGQLAQAQQASMPLTDLRIKRAKPRAKHFKLSDGAGLQLVVRPSGGRSWKLAYRFGGKQRELTIGAYPLIDLQEARQLRDAAKRLLVAGVNPAQQKALDKLSKVTSAKTTFALVSGDLLEKKRREGKAENTLSKLEWLFGIANDAIGPRSIAEVTAPDRARRERSNLRAARGFDLA
jgi:hypothetical protein